MENENKSAVQNRTNSKELVPPWYFTAFGLRMQGLTYDQIAESVRKSPAHVRSLFAKSGAMYEYWREYASIEQQDNVEAAIDMVFGKLPTLMRAAINTALMPNMAGVVQRERLFDYTLGKPEDRIKIQATVGIFNMADWAMAQAEKIKEYESTGRSSETITEVAEES